MSDPANPYDSPQEKSMDVSPVRNNRRWMFWAGTVFVLGAIVSAGIAYWYFVNMPIRRYYGV